MPAANHPGSLVETAKLRLASVLSETVGGVLRAACGLKIHKEAVSALPAVTFNPALEPRSFGTIEGLRRGVCEDPG
jgi:hypothetical protein